MPFLLGVRQFYRGGHAVDADHLDDDATPNMATCRLDTPHRTRSEPTPPSGNDLVSPTPEWMAFCS
jgi:hypothetical protein